MKPKLKEPWATEYKETKALLWPKAKARKGWLVAQNFSDMRDTFEDLLQNAGVSTYQDGHSAFLGSYNSLYDFAAAKVVCSEFNVQELEKLRDYYRGTGYLSPIFNLVASSCEAAIKEKS